MRFKKRTVLTAGFAMFSMFFGSGNLVFPLVIGKEAMDQATPAMFGLLSTGIIVPFLGLIGVILFAGNRNNFFACIGRVPAFILTFAMLAMMGPVGVMPRCIIVAHGGITLFAPWLSLPIFSALFCLITLVLVWNHDRVVPIIGRILTPGLLVGLLVVIVTGLLKGPALLDNGNTQTTAEVFLGALFEGYQTMDLLAAFFFSATTVAYLRAHLRSDDRPNTLLKLSVVASIIGATLLAIVYLGFVQLGAMFGPELAEIRPEQMIVAIAAATLGPIAVPIISITIALACLTTATILVMLFADFFHEDVTRNKFGRHKSVFLTLAACYIVSLVGFDSLRSWIGMVLVIAYPALIVLTISNIISKLAGWSSTYLSRWGFWLAFTISLGFKVFG